MATYIKGSYSKSIYENHTGYTIGIFKVSDTNDEKLADYIGRSITFTGYFHDLNQIDTYIFYGKRVVHDKYGEQFQVDHYERSKPEEKDSIIEFLTSGLFKGIGEKKAKAIVDTLGKDTLKVILETPDNLILIPGISQTNINVLHSKLKEYESSYEGIMYLSDMGFSSRDSMIIYNTYQKSTKKVIEDNIYQLIDDILELSFKKIDMIAMKNGVLLDDKNRVKAAIIYIMNEISNTYGHCYYSREEILTYLPRVLNCEVNNKCINQCLGELEKDLKIIIKDDRIYLREIYDAECLIVKRCRMLNKNKEQEIKNLLNYLEEVESHLGITYNDSQKEAILNSVRKDFYIVTGGPGTGKTTIMKGILELYRQLHHYSYREMNEKVALLAPTGRAAKRMSETTMYPASTIHRFLKWQKESNKFQVNEYNKSKVELIILDEASMIDTLLMSSLLKGISSRCRIIMVGDDHQLPSVGPGDMLHDFIESQKLDYSELTELYRQGKDSNIIELAYDIRRKDVSLDIFNVDADLTFIECSDKDVIQNISEIATAYQDLEKKDFQILAPMYKGLNGIDAINDSVQTLYNPRDKDKNEIKIGDIIIREGDKVIQLTNQPDDNVYNGDIGFVDHIMSHSKKEIVIDFDGNQVKYTPSNYHNFRLAYAISIHKSQGSEFDTVVIPIVKGYRKMLYQKLIYTAVTRAKKNLYLVGDFEALKYASSNDQEDLRRTSIKDFLIDGIK